MADFVKSCVVDSFINAMSMMPRASELWEGLITDLVAVAMAVLVESSRWRLEIGWPIANLCFIYTGSRVCCGGSIACSDSGVHSRISRCLTSSEEARVGSSVVVDDLARIS